ncbi:hypothetical protein C0J27_05310 [Candidatus Chromulinivorax destructor]|uniref:Uncharacterized protein n=1 Tax=Candidatus Chromulinivorax destructor TaxID=2066483 RepID=A0A345ZCV4_9BACT|nr:hypothetical protein C0J27_05310 [Candidatus Chromulinivorax destructor]
MLNALLHKHVEKYLGSVNQFIMREFCPTFSMKTPGICRPVGLMHYFFTQKKRKVVAPPIFAKMSTAI